MRIEQSGSAITVSDPAGLDSSLVMTPDSCVACELLGSHLGGRLGGDLSTPIRILAPLPGTVSGGDGNDRSRAAWGRDAQWRRWHDSLSPGLGADRINGGAGSDTADYGVGTNPLTLSIDGQANDGEALERDTIGTDVESLIAGSGNDTITGSAVGNGIWGAGRR